MVYENMAVEHVEHTSHMCKISRQTQDEEEHIRVPLIVHFVILLLFLLQCD
jgi:hypothetical protein